MHILMIVLGAIAFIGGLIWRLQAASQAGAKVADMAQTAANLPRKLAFRRKTGKRGSQLVTDAREAAVILMLEIVRASGEMSRQQKDTILSIIQSQFDFSPEDSEEILVQASWVSQIEAGKESMQRRLTRLITEQVSEKDVVELDGMLVEVSEADGMPTSEQLAVLQVYRRVAGVVA